MPIYDKSSRAAIMDMMVKMCMRAKDANGRTPWGYTSKLIAEYGETFPFLTNASIRMAVMRAEQSSRDRRYSSTFPNFASVSGTSFNVSKMKFSLPDMMFKARHRLIFILFLFCVLLISSI